MVPEDTTIDGQLFLLAHAQLSYASHSCCLVLIAGAVPNVS